MESDSFKSSAILLPSDTLFALLENQAKEFETFGKRMILDVQNAYKFYIQEQAQNELFKTSDLDNILEKQKSQLESQSKLIDSLRSRIEELENDSIKKNYEIKKLKNEFLDFKKEIKLLFGLENSSQSFNLEKGNSLYEGNDSDEFEFINSETKYVESLTATDNIQQNDIINNNIIITRSNGLNERLIAENNQSNKIDINKERLIFPNIQQKVIYGINEVLPIPTEDQNVEKKVPAVENKKTSIFGSVLFDEYFYSHSTLTDHSESSTSSKSSSNYDFNMDDRKTRMITNGLRTIDFVLQQSEKTTNQVKSSSAVSKGKSKELDSKILVEDHIKEEFTEQTLSDHRSEEELEEDIKYNPLQRSFQDPNKNTKATQKLRDLLLDLKATEFESKEKNNVNNLKDDFITKVSSSLQQKNNISCLPPISVKPQVNSTSISSSQNKPVQGSQKKLTVIEQIHAEVQYTIALFREQNLRIKQKTFNYLLNQFALESMIKYQDTALYNSLARDPKRSIKLTVKTALRSELCNKDKRVSQPIEEYVKRKIIPSLPPGISSYTEYERSGYFPKLSDEKKKRIRKIITVE